MRIILILIIIGGISIKILGFENKTDEEVIQFNEAIQYKFKNKTDEVVIQFNMENNKELMKFCSNGEIYHKGKLVITNKEIVDGLFDIISYYRCPTCKKSLINKEATCE